MGLLLTERPISNNSGPRSGAGDGVGVALGAAVAEGIGVGDGRKVGVIVGDDVLVGRVVGTGLVEDGRTESESGIGVRVGEKVAAVIVVCEGDCNSFAAKVSGGVSRHKKNQAAARPKIATTPR